MAVYTCQALLATVDPHRSFYETKNVFETSGRMKARIRCELEAYQASIGAFIVVKEASGELLEKMFHPIDVFVQVLLSCPRLIRIRYESLNACVLRQLLNCGQGPIIYRQKSIDFAIVRLNRVAQFLLATLFLQLLVSPMNLAGGLSLELFLNHFLHKLIGKGRRFHARSGVLRRLRADAVD